MPSIYKLSNGQWRAQVRRKGKSSSKRFSSKLMAKEWAFKEEARLADPTYAAKALTLSDVLDRYVKEISIHKPTQAREEKRAEFIKRFDIADLPIGSITKTHINDFQVERLKKVKPSTVERDFSFLGSVFEMARRRWEYIKTNPVHEADKPKRTPPRKQRIPQERINAIIKALGYTEDTEIDTTYKQVAVIFLVAIETAMRQAEITYLKWYQIEGRTVYLPKTKNGDSREVPLSKRAVELIGKLPQDRERLFTVSVATVSSVFRRIRRRVGYHDITFHDSRREATSRLAKKFKNPLMLAKITGHKDLQMLLDVYYAPERDDFIEILDS